MAGTRGSRSAKVTLLDRIVAWARSHSLEVYPFAMGCCGAELSSLVGPRYDVARFGVTLPAIDPSRADVLLIGGPVAPRMVPILARVYRELPDPKWVIAMGACAGARGHT